MKKTIKRMVFENAYESSIIFQSFLYANIPAESPSYAPTFSKNLFLFSSDREAGLLRGPRQHREGVPPRLPARECPQPHGVPQSQVTTAFGNPRPIP